jgi:hypothetical protein
VVSETLSGAHSSLLLDSSSVGGAGLTAGPTADETDAEDNRPLDLASVLDLFPGTTVVNEAPPAGLPDSVPSAGDEVGAS